MRGSARSKGDDRPPWIRQDEDHDLDDEWFFGSISRYDHLCMYALSCVPVSLDLSPDGTHLALCGRILTPDEVGLEAADAGAVEELMVLAVPDKLLLADDPRREGLRCNRRDFSFVAGARQRDRSPFLQVSFLAGNENLLTLSKDGIVRWTSQTGTDVLVATNSVDFIPSSSALNFRISNDLLVAYGTSDVWCFKVGCPGELRQLASWQHPVEHGKLQDVAADSVSGEVLMATSAGKVLVAKVTSSDVESSSIDASTTNGEADAIHTSSKSVLCHPDTTLFAVVREGELSVRSRKTLDSLAKAQKDETLSDSPPSRLRWEARREEMLMVSAVDNVVRVYSIDEATGEIRFKFGHDGHRARVTDFISHSQVANLHFSSDARGFLHAWAVGKKTLGRQETIL